jgi:ankyrin repeat protein
MALPRLRWPAADPRWDWILTQPMRGIENDGRDHQGFFACMQVLLESGISPDVSSRFRQRALHYGAARGGLSEAERVPFAAMLLDYGARLEGRDDLLGSTPLGWACRWGRRELVEFLIARGAAVREPEAETWATPLAWATKMGHAEIAAVLRRHGA